MRFLVAAMPRRAGKYPWPGRQNPALDALLPDATSQVPVGRSEQGFVRHHSLRPQPAALSSI